MQIELVQFLQLALMLFVLISVTYYAINLLKSCTYLTTETLRYSEIKSGIAYSNELTVVESECYHKYQIWRFYLFS